MTRWHQHKEAFLVQWRRDMLVLGRRQTWVVPLSTWLILTSLVPMTLRGDSQLVQVVISPVLWSALLVSSLMATAQLFHADRQAKALVDHWYVAGQCVALFALAQLLAHWLITLGMLVLASAVGLWLLGNYGVSLFAVLSALALGTLSLSAIGMVAAALSSGGGSMLVAVIALPLGMPVLMLGNAITEADRVRVVGERTGMPLLALACMSLLYLVAAPVLTALLLTSPEQDL